MDCESGVQQLIAEAAQEGDYGAVAALSAVAQRIADLKGEVGKDGWGILGGHSSVSRRAPAGKQPRKARRKPPKKAGRSGYPKFVRRGDNLVKIGWSKREKAEYKHRVPWTTAQQIINAIAKVGPDGIVFTSEDFLALAFKEEEGDIPTYQAYLIMTWLLQCGLAIRHGRQGYTLVDAAGLSSSLESVWKGLSQE